MVFIIIYIIKLIFSTFINAFKLLFDFYFEINKDTLLFWGQKNDSSIS